MTAFHPGDRVRVESLGADGLPMVRYGFVRHCVDDDAAPVMVLLDDDITAGALVERRCVHPVSITSLELRLDGTDLLDDAGLRRGLVELWAGEAEAAGLEVRALHHTGDGLRDSSEGYVIAELVAGGEQYVLRAVCTPAEPDLVRVRAERPNRWPTPWSGGWTA